ncbi:MAG TPA: DsrE/DsrF/DrsH-like family protein [Actinomycetota bacterium]|nr:DsrE/DsrF/DrsH-like family protein [Actinomycetota bacterium]
MTDTPNGNGTEKNDKLSIIAWSGDLDRIWPTLILSTTAAASGMEASVFFTFWGLFPLVKDGKRITGNHWMQKGLSAINPGGIDKLKLSKLNFAGAGPWMMKSLAKDNKVPNPRELLELAQEMGVRLIPCQMTMDLLGLTQDDLIEGLEEPVGAATALLEMKDASIQLFI